MWIRRAWHARVIQLDANKRREAELLKLRRDLDEAHAQNEAQVSALRKKQQDTINEMSEQLEALQKLKQKYDYFTTSAVHIVEIFQNYISRCSLYLLTCSLLELKVTNSFFVIVRLTKTQLRLSASVVEFDSTRIMAPV